MSGQKNLSYFDPCCNSFELFGVDKVDTGT